MKIQQQDDELKYCTFQPNINKEKPNIDVNETIKKLYLDGVTKIKAKNDEKKVEPENPMDCTFVPKVNKLYIFYF